MTEILNTATSGDSFAVCKLADFKGKELEQGQYLVRKIEKGTGLESKGAIIPATDSESLIVALENDVILNAATNWYQEQIAECCKAAISKGATLLTASDYSLDQVIEMLQAKEISEGRVSKEKIAAWFDSSVADTLKQAFMQKLGIGTDAEKLKQILNSYRAVFQLLAKRELMLDATKRTNLDKALALLPASNMKAYCTKKLETEQADAEEMLGL